MIVFEINSVPYGSTGRIMLQIADMVKSVGGTAYTSASFTKSRGEQFPDTYYRIGGAVGKTEHIILAKLTGRHGYYSHFATYKLIKKIKQVKPDVIHLHNVHGWYLNWKMLFDYLKKANIPVIWTLHDCWAFTGHCPHFMAIGCDKWKTGCYECPLYKSYPGCFFDDSRFQYRYKKECFTGVPNLTIVTPSQWLADLVKQSYLKDYDTVVINNGIDLTKFKPRASDFRAKYGLENKILILGVAFDWTPKKGLDDFKRLAEDLPEEYEIVLVGVSDIVATTLPERIISVACTQNQEELAEIYSASDIFVNPTHEEVLGLVNLEALACGTPVITYESGGSPETIDGSCGVVVPSRNCERLLQAIIEFDFQKMRKESCCQRAKLFDKNVKYQEYIELYKTTMEKNSNG